ncbi:MAG: VWA domain-containing protein [Deltaproteobacteria bacterium]|nr:VWA domain-containing protein [Deltaproteobacteria bacterium]
MPVVPGPTLLFAILIPLAISAFAIAGPELRREALAADVAIALFAAVDLLFVRRPLVAIRRVVPPIASIGRTLMLELEAESLARFPLALKILVDVEPSARVDGSMLLLELPALARRTLHLPVRPRQRGELRIGASFVRYASPAGFWIRQLRLDAEDSIFVAPDLRGARDLAGAAVAEPSTERLVVLVDAGRSFRAPHALDSALDTAVAISARCAERRDEIGLVVFRQRAVRVLPPRSNRTTHAAFVKALSAIEAADEPVSYEAALRAAHAHSRGSSRVVLFARITDEQSLVELLEAVGGHAQRREVIVALLRDPEVDQLARAGGGAQRVAERVVSLWDRAALALVRLGATAVVAPPSELRAATLRALDATRLEPLASRDELPLRPVA